MNYMTEKQLVKAARWALEDEAKAKNLKGRPKLIEWSVGIPGPDGNGHPHVHAIGTLGNLILQSNIAI